MVFLYIALAVAGIALIETLNWITIGVAVVHFTARRFRGVPFGGFDQFQIVLVLALILIKVARAVFLALP